MLELVCPKFRGIFVPQNLCSQSSGLTPSLHNDAVPEVKKLALRNIHSDPPVTFTMTENSNGKCNFV